MAESAPRVRSRKPKYLRYVVLSLMIAGVAGGGYYVKTRPLKVTVSNVVRGTAVDAVYATGTVEAEDRVDVKAKSSGSIAELLVKEGAVVKKGDLLARIDNPSVTYDLKRGQADLSAASAQAATNAPQIAALRGQAQAIQADLTNARAELQRTKDLMAGGAVPQSELDRAQARVGQLEGQLAANEAQQRATRIDLNANAERQAANVRSLASRVTDTEVRAPMDGVVLSKKIEIGEVVAVNQTLFRIGDIKRLILEVSVDEADIAKVFDGNQSSQASRAAVSLFAFPGTAFGAKVFEILPDANRDRKAFLVKLRLDNPPAGLRSGMSAEVNIIAAERPGVVLAPVESLVDGHTWVVRGENVEKRAIKTGLKDLLRIEITEGLKEGETVVVEGQDKLKESSRVTTKERPQDKLAPAPDPNQPKTK